MRATEVALGLALDVSTVAQGESYRAQRLPEPFGMVLQLPAAATWRLVGETVVVTMNPHARHAHVLTMTAKREGAPAAQALPGVHRIARGRAAFAFGLGELQN